MNLYQLLRMVNESIPIIICDLKGARIYQAYYKKDIPTELYEYFVMQISAGFLDNTPTIPALYIMLQK